MYRNLILLVLSIVLSLPSPVFSQGLVEEELKQSERTCRMVFPEKPSGSPRFVYLFDGKENHKLYLSAVNFSPVVKLPFGEITIIMAPKPIVDIENIPASYPKLRLSKELRNFYLFLTPDSKNKAMPLRMQMVSIDSGKFKPGDTLWYNLTQHNIAAKLGQEKLALRPRKSAISKKPRGESGYYDAQFVFQANGKGDFRRITEQRWWLDVSSRYVGFIADRGGRLPRIYFFRDYRSKFKDEPLDEEPVEDSTEDLAGGNG